MSTGSSSFREALRPLRTVRIDVGEHPITAAPQITAEARALLDRLPAITAPGHSTCATQVQRRGEWVAGWFGVFADEPFGVRVLSVGQDFGAGGPGV